VLGLKRLGFRVLLIEQVGPARCSDAALKYFASTCHAFGLTGSAALIAESSSLLGPSFGELRTAAREAALLVNISGNLTCAALLERFRRRAFVDLDPGFTQVWHGEGHVAALERHHSFFTVGERIGDDDCPIPTCGVDWRPLPPPVVLDEWPVKQVPAGRFTTVATWRGPCGTLELGGRVLGSKVHEFRKVMALPTRRPETFELALDIHEGDRRDLEALRAHAWRVVAPNAVASDPSAFRRYVQGSSAEFSVAQGAYVATRCGWVSDRTVRYLASGKPALVQDTGFSASYPTGEGLVPFTTFAEAVDGAAAIAASYHRHCAAARRLAERHFDSDVVLGRFLREAGVR
jgi:hypothetical protein